MKIARITLQQAGILKEMFGRTRVPDPVRKPTHQERHERLDSSGYPVGVDRELRKAARGERVGFGDTPILDTGTQGPCGYMFGKELALLLERMIRQGDWWCRFVESDRLYDRNPSDNGRSGQVRRRKLEVVRSGRPGGEEEDVAVRVFEDEAGRVSLYTMVRIFEEIGKGRVGMQIWNNPNGLNLVVFVRPEQGPPELRQRGLTENRLVLDLQRQDDEIEAEICLTEANTASQLPSRIAAPQLSG